MNILHYDSNKYSYEEIYEMMCFFRDKDVDIIAIPKDIDVLIDCDTFTLYTIKKKIEEAIRIKELLDD